MTIFNKVTTTYIGIILFLAFVIQSIFQFTIEPLNTLQDEEMYKRWSGLGVSIFILLQWLLTIFRITSINDLRLETLNLKWLDIFLKPRIFIGVQF